MQSKIHQKWMVAACSSTIIVKMVNINKKIYRAKKLPQGARVFSAWEGTMTDT